MNCGIIGLPNVGKSALFNLLTENSAPSSNYPYCTVDPNKGIAYFKDKRLNKLQKVFNSKKKTYPYIKFIDVAGLPPGASKGEGLGNQFLATIREAYAILHVVRDFTSSDVPRFDKDRSDAARDLQLVQTELFLADMQIAERRLEDNPESEYWKETYEKLSKEEKPDKDPENVLLTAKPQIILVNTTTGTKKPEITGENIIYADVKFQEELLSMGSEERKEFSSMAAEWESSIDEIMEEVKKMLNLITFFTVEGENRATGYNIKKGSSVYEAAGKVHTDMQKHFIKAEVYNYSDLKEHEYSKRELREAGKIRMEGKDYTVKEGDVVKIMFGAN